jgi:hypothetical protein
MCYCTTRRSNEVVISSNRIVSGRLLHLHKLDVCMNCQQEQAHENVNNITNETRI